MQPKFGRNLLLLSSLVLLLPACETGYNKSYYPDEGVDPPECASGTANNNANDQTERVFNLLAGLTCNEAENDGYLMGQNVGYGNQIADPDGFASYERLIEGFRAIEDNQHTPAMVAIDYEFDRIYSDEALLEANDELVAHWEAENNSGFVSVSWMPINPWTNDADSDAPEQGTTAYTEDVDLALLLDEEDTDGYYSLWRRKLDHVAEALADLQDQGVTVLWRPLPEMNNGRFWWGAEGSFNFDDVDNAERYTNLWQDMFDYFTQEKGLDNLLWVYSPAEGAELTLEDGETDAALPSDLPVSWAWPGDGYVDVVGAIVRDDQLIIPDYDDLVDLGKPLGLAEYGPLAADAGGQYTATGDFDNRTYADKLRGNYPFVSYWVTWHSYDTDTETGSGAIVSFQALVDNLFNVELANKDYVLTLERSQRHDLR